MMNKILYMVLAATIIIGCSDNNNDYETNNHTERILFESPVIGSSTRAALTSATYPEDGRFRVYAQRHMDAYQNGWDNNFMDGIEVFMHIVNGTQKYWMPEKNYFWPKYGYVSFAAYSPSSISASYAADGLTVTDYVLADALADQKDLLYSGRMLNKRKDDMWDLGNATGNPDYYGLNISFRHAMSLITFTIKSDFPNVTLKEIIVNNARDKGTFKENITDDATSKAAPSWESVNYKPYSAKVLNVFNDSQLMTTLTTKVPGSLLMIPQALQSSSEPQSVTIKWTYMNGGDNGTVVDDETTVDLYDLGGIKKWDIGKRYTYNIIINLDKIYFNPTVTDWTEENPQDVVI